MEIILGAMVTAFGSVIVALLNRQRKTIDKELRPNGGSSFRDLVDTMATSVMRIEEKLDQHIRSHNDS